MSASLNKENLIPADLRRVQNENWVTDLLLKSDLQVPWRRRQVFVDQEFYQVLDYAQVDLTNTGSPIAVIRWGFSDSGGYQNLIFLPATVPEEFASDTPLRSGIIRKIFGPNAANLLKVDQASAPELWKGPNYPLNGSFDFNIVEVQNKAVLIAAAAVDANRAVFEGGTFDVYVLDYHSGGALSLVCHLRGGKKK